MFLYYIPGVGRPMGDPSMLPKPVADAGLASVMRGGSMESREGGGPDGGTGLLLRKSVSDKVAGTNGSKPVAADHLHYKADAQTWEPWHAGGDAPVYWVGLPNGAKPGPSDLARETVIPGNDAQPAARLLDGNDWAVPCVGFSVDGGVAFSKLPKVFRLVAGKPASHVREEWRALFNDASKAAGVVYDGGGWSTGEALSYCCRVLGVNYRVGEPECLMLGLLGVDEMHEVMRLSVGFPDLDAARKKAEAAA